MIKRILMATMAAFFVSLKKETRRSISKYTRRVVLIVVGIFAMLFALIFLNIMTMLLVVLK